MSEIRTRFCAVLAILLGAGYLSLDWYMQWRAVNDLQSQLVAMKTRLVIAHADVDRLTAKLERVHRPWWRRLLGR